MLHKRLKLTFKKFSRQIDGTTAIEFSLLALPFMILIFGILELAIVFFTTTSLQHNLTTQTRSIRVGDEAALCGGIEDLKVDLCNSLNVQNCLTNLSLNISRVESDQFDAAVLAQFQETNFTVNTSDDDSSDDDNGNNGNGNGNGNGNNGNGNGNNGNNGNGNNGNGNGNTEASNETITLINPDEIAEGIVGDEILIVKAVYQLDLILPGKLTRLSNFGLSDKRILSVTQAMRTEPFPDVTCGGAITG